MRQLLPLITSAFTLWGMWLAGSTRSLAWIVGLGNQTLWLAFIIVFEAWGLLPLNFALCVIYSRNLIRWRREERAVLPLMMGADAADLDEVRARDVPRPPDPLDS